MQKYFLQSLFKCRGKEYACFYHRFPVFFKLALVIHLLCNYEKKIKYAREKNIE